ncbi:MAG: metallophosphoesterase [Bryobacteraceae bacterium]
MRYLIVSDIHGNWEALEAVLSATAGRFDQVLCCGDLVGYGADPNRVAEWACGNAAVVVRGNHDRAAVGLDDLEWFNPMAKRAALWTQAELTPGNAAYIRALPQGPVRVADFQLAHGSLVDEDEYLVEEADAAQSFYYAAVRVSFFGHTHVQGGFVLGESGIDSFRGPRKVKIESPRYYLLNPGSVGQPRDGDPRAAYAIFDAGEQVVSYYRLAYDLAAAQRKIRDAGLPPVLADRLVIGR